MKEFLADAELALSKFWGNPLKLAFAQSLSENRLVTRLNVLSSSAGLPKTVILKACRKDGDEGFDADFSASDFLNEWASLEYMAQIFGKSVLSPQVYTGDKEKGFLVIEDLPAGNTIEKILNGENLAKAEDALRTYGEGLGKFHAQTLGQMESFYALRKNLGLSDTWKPFEPLGYLQAGLKTLEALNFEIRASAYNELEEAAAQLSRIAGWTVLHHGDPAPNNSWIDNTNRLYFLDFESARFDHALLEAVNPRMGFPTWGMLFVNRIPENIWRKAETAYLKALASRCPEAADARVYGPIIAVACASMDNWFLRELVREGNSWRNPSR
jgi:tRNA A-37 threonylcarbamoyl transferase component Bud32